MNFSQRSIVTFVTAGLLILATWGCSDKSRKARYVEQADRFYADGKYDEAEIDYKNALLIEAFDPHAVGQLGMIYTNQGRLTTGLVYLAKARELQPENLDVRVKLAQLDFAFGKVAQGRENVLYVLKHRPTDPDAPILLADLSRTPKEMEEARAVLNALPPAAVQGAPVILALGYLDFRQQHVKEAEAAFRRALSIDPKSAEAHSAMAGFYRTKQDLPNADKEYALAAELSPIRSPRRVQYAQFKMQTGDLAGARKLLEEFMAKAPDFLPAMTVLAQLAATEKKYDEASALVTKVLAKHENYPEALMLGARVELARGNVDKAIAQAQKVIRLFPKSAEAHHVLALGYLAKNDLDKARDNLTQAVALAPNFAEASIILANLNNRKGVYATSVISMRKLIQQHPELPQAWMQLAEAYRGQGNEADALAVYQEMEKRFPKLPQPPFLMGMILRDLNKPVDARAAFERALAVAPDFPQAVEQLVVLDVTAKNFSAAIERAEALVAKNPKRGAAYELLAKIYVAEKDEAKAEATLRKAIEADPESTAAYYMLASIYLTNNQLNKALADAKELIAKNPHDARALMLTALLQDGMKDYAAARDTYEKLVEIRPKFAPALNNLAYIYAERFNEFGKAQEAAQKAHDIVPEDPRITDTLAWVLFRQQQYAKSVALLDDIAGKVEDSAEIQYHLGMARYMTGNEAGARRALNRALQLNPTMPGASDARACLALLDLDPAKASRAELEKALATRPNDPAALALLGAVFEREGAADKAIAAYESAAKIAPSTKVTLGLIRLYSAKPDLPKALELAKAARKAAPNDPAVAYVMGKLAFQSRDFTWSLSLLQDAVRATPEDPETQFDYALAAYANGKVADADEALKTALQLNPSFSRANAANHMRELLAIAASSDSTKRGTVEQALKADASDVPALIASATIAEKSGKRGDAAAAYEKALARFPGFTPAKRALAIYYADNPGDDQKAYELATKAREAFPDDPAVGKALGIILYRRGDFARAASLLGSVSAQTDPESLFYLGQAQVRLKNTAAAKKSLQKALDLNLKSELAADARKALAELK